MDNEELKDHQLSFTIPCTVQPVPFQDLDVRLTIHPDGSACFRCVEYPQFNIHIQDICKPTNGYKRIENATFNVDLLITYTPLGMIRVKARTNLLLVQAVFSPRPLHFDHSKDHSHRRLENPLTEHPVTHLL